MPKVILITGPQGSGKTILTDIMSYEHERINYGDLRSKQQLEIALEFKSLDKVIIEDCWNEPALPVVVDACRRLKVDAIFISDIDWSEFPESLFDIKYEINSEFCNISSFKPIVKNQLQEYMEQLSNPEKAKLKEHDNFYRDIANERPNPPEAESPRSRKETEVPIFPKDKKG